MGAGIGIIETTRAILSSNVDFRKLGWSVLEEICLRKLLWPESTKTKVPAKHDGRHHEYRRSTK